MLIYTRKPKKGNKKRKKKKKEKKSQNSLSTCRQQMQKYRSFLQATSVFLSLVSFGGIT